MITVEKILFLRNVALFATMPPREHAHLADIAEEFVYPEGSSIIKEGEDGDSLFIIVEGEVRIHRQELELAVLGAREYFGEMSILSNEPRSASAAALSDCLLLRIGQVDFHEVLSRHFEITLAVIRTLTQRLRETEAFRRSASTSDAQEEAIPDEQNLQ